MVYFFLLLERKIRDDQSIYTNLIASEEALKEQSDLEAYDGITAEKYYQYKTAVAGLTRKAAKLAAINGLDLLDEEKDALYFANGWAESKLSEAPWRSNSSYVEMPVLGNSGTTMPVLSRKHTSELEMPVLGKATYSGVEMPILGSRGSAGIQMPVLGERYEYYDAADNRPAPIIGQQYEYYGDGARPAPVIGEKHSPYFTDTVEQSSRHTPVIGEAYTW